MSSDQWLANLLATQNLTESELANLRSLRDSIENQLRSGLQGGPRFYYAGSYAKRTIIRQRYDLDIVVYWPYGTQWTLQQIYERVGQTLKRHWDYVTPKTVSWELPFNGGFHIDVVPGRALDNQYKEANLYRTDKGTSLKTSLKTHIDTVRYSGRNDAIRLMKLWRERKKVPFKKSFLLEMMTINGCKGVSTTSLSDQVMAAMKYIRDNIVGYSILDPANSNNSLSDDLSTATRQQIKEAAAAAVNAQYWSNIF